MPEEYISNVSEQITPPTDIPPSAKPMSKIIIIIGGLILLLIGLSAGFILFKSSSTENPKTQPEDRACTQDAKICPDGSSVSRTGPNCEFAQCPQITNTPSPISNLSIDASQSATANWKTYTSSKYGLTFKYPKDYQMEERVDGFFVISTPGVNAPQAGISIDARLQDFYQNYDKAIESIFTSLNILQSSKLGDWNIYVGEGKEGEVKGIKFKQAIIHYKTGALGVEMINIEPYNRYYDQILSTFKFTDSNQDKQFNNTLETLKKIVSDSDFAMLANYTDLIEVACNSDGPLNPSICKGVPNGEKMAGYNIGYNMSEGGTYSKTEFINNLSEYFSKYGLFNYHGIVSQDNKAVVVWLDKDKKWLFALLMKKGITDWKINTVLLGVVSNNFVNLDEAILNYIN